MRLYQGDFKGALKAADERADDLRQRGVDNEDPNTSRLLDDQGPRALRVSASSARRGPRCRSAEARRKQVGTDHPKYATHRANLATVQEAQGGRPSAARDAYEFAVRVYRAGAGRLGHPNLIDIYANLGSLLVRLRGFRGREGSHLCKALGLNEQLRGTGHTLVGNDHANLGRYYYDSGRPAGGPRAVRQGAGYLRGTTSRQAAAAKASVHRGGEDLAETGRMLGKATAKKRRRSADGRRNALTGEPIARRCSPRMPVRCHTPKGPPVTQVSLRCTKGQLPLALARTYDGPRRYRDYNRVVRSGALRFLHWQC